MHKELALALSILLFVPVSVAQDNRAERINEAASAYLRENRVVGASVALLEGGRIVFANGYGFADREAGRRASVATVYRLGSVSKPITALAVMRLIQSGKAELDRDVRTYVPEFPAKPWPITPRQALSHTSGIRHYQPAKADGGDRFYTASEALGLFAGDPLLFEPGTKYGYSTHAYTLLARLVETASGEEFPVHLRRNIVPFGGPSLACELLSVRKLERTALYRPRDGKIARETKIEDNSWKFGGGGMESNAVDLAYLAYATLRDRVVHSSSRKAMWTPTVLKDGKRTGYGLGWQVLNDGRVGHNGAQQGAASSLRVDPQRGLIVVVLTNTSGNRPEKLAEAVWRIWTGQDTTSPSP